MTELTVVTDYLASLPRAFILWMDVDLDAYVDLIEDLKADYFITNYDDVLPAVEIPLARHLLMLAQANVVVLPDTWWTEVIGHQIMQIAGWLGCKFMDYEGTPIETLSLVRT